MPRALRLHRWFPTDPGYAPFGIAALRGLNGVPLALVAGLGLVLALQRVFRGLTMGEPWLDTLWRPLAGILQLEAAFLPLLAFVAWALNRSADTPRLRRLLMLAGAVLAGSLVFAAVWSTSFCVVGRTTWSQGECALFHNGQAHVALGLLWGGLVAALLWYDRREREAAHALAETRLRRIDVDRQETEARLRTLQAQIEPHFLFNTLAHIQRLQQVDAPRGRVMLASLIDYMQAALPRMRDQQATLRREIELVRAYVNVQQIRMGDRLRADFDVPDALLDARLPPMIVLTLAENAVKHGLSPKREGGLLQVSARRLADGRLEVEVCDDGVGLRVGSGSGTGLANTRARLAAHHGGDAALVIGSRPDGPGVRAAVVLPFEPAP
jgi:signal transduction histidine kinase